MIPWWARNSLLRHAACCAGLFCGVLLCTGVICASGGGDSNRVHWKQIPEGQLKLDSKVPLVWNIYLPDKKKLNYLVLVLIGRRYIALDLKAKTAYAMVPEDLKAIGKDFESDPPMKPERVIPTTDWSLRDAGPAEIVKLTLGDYGRELEVQLPHIPDLRLGIY